MRDVPKVVLRSAWEWVSTISAHQPRWLSTKKNWDIAVGTTMTVGSPTINGIALSSYVVHRTPGLAVEEATYLALTSGQGVIFVSGFLDVLDGDLL